jgi:hypothetical protein
MALRIQAFSNPAEAGPVFAEAADTRTCPLFPSVNLDVSDISAAPMSIGSVPDPFSLPNLVLHGIAVAQAQTGMIVMDYTK